MVSLKSSSCIYSTGFGSISLLLVTEINDKGFPNPNVMFELGYAIKSLGDKKITIVFNLDSGQIKNMPFDLSLKRQLTYACNNENTKSENKKILANKLNNSFELIYKYI